MPTALFAWKNFLGEERESNSPGTILTYALQRCSVSCEVTVAGSAGTTVTDANSRCVGTHCIPCSVTWIRVTSTCENKTKTQKLFENNSSSFCVGGNAKQG